MAGRIYLMPMIGAGGKADPPRPKYLSTFDTFTYAMIPYGAEPVCLVYITDIDGSTHTLLSANADVISVPNNIDSQIGAGALTAVKNALESLNIPAGFVQASDTYRETVRVIGAIFQFVQRMNGITPGKLLTGGVTLNTQFNQLPQAMRTLMIDAAASMNFDSSSISGASTLRTIFKAMADQWGNRPLVLNDLVI
jgi:hypothetical protein